MTKDENHKAPLFYYLLIMTFSTPSCAFTAAPLSIPHHLLPNCDHRLPTSPPRRRRPPQEPLYQFTTSSSEFDKDYSKYQGDDDDDSNARSQFGTKSYWDAMYEGMGDFDADEYSWYYGFEVVKPYLLDYTENDDGKKQDKSTISILIPGCGNDPMLLDLYNAGYHRLTAFDYSEGAIERQKSLLEYLPIGSNYLENVELSVEDARSLPTEWEQSFDIIIEKGALDAIYLSGDGNFEQSVSEFSRCLKSGGICMSFSGVVPEEVRRDGFNEDNWEWLRDGSEDLKAGCFVLRKR